MDAVSSIFAAIGLALKKNKNNPFKSSLKNNFSLG
jgi:hypothetical protein